MNKKSVQLISLTAEELVEIISQKMIPILFYKLSQHLQPKEPEEYLTIEQLCELLKKDRSTIWRWTKSKVISAYQIGGSPLYKRSEIESLLNENKVN